MKNSLKHPIKALLFDLGGVVIDIDFDLVFSKWAEASNSDIQEIKSNFKFDHHYKAHERGEISAGEYFRSLRKSLKLDLSDAQLEEGWNAIFKGEIPGISDLLNQISGRIPLYVFTNSNQTHQKVWSVKFAKTLSVFRTIFDSSDIGKRKPEPEAYQLVADLMGIKLNEMIFYDDSIENINGAKNIGINAVHVRSIRDIERSLNSLQINS